MHHANSIQFCCVFVPLHNLHDDVFETSSLSGHLFCWWDLMTSKSKRAILWHILTLSFLTHMLSFCFKDVSCSQSTRLFHSDAKEAASSASLWVLHNADFKCGTLNCFHAARESVPVQAQTRDIHHAATAALFTSSREKPAADSELRQMNYSPFYDVRNKPLILLEMWEVWLLKLSIHFSICFFVFIDFFLNYYCLFLLKRQTTKLRFWKEIVFLRKNIFSF